MNFYLFINMNAILIVEVFVFCHIIWGPTCNILMAKRTALAQRLRNVQDPNHQAN